MGSQSIEIAMPDGTAEAYVSRPATGGPGVLLYIDAIGLRPRIHDMADRIASWGHVVMAPNAFYRDGRVADLAPTTDLRQPGARDDFFAGIGDRIANYTPERSDRDLDSYVETLLGLDGVAGPTIGVTGYCIGGRSAIRAAGLRPDVVAAAGAFHAAGLVTDADDSPHRLVTRAAAEILAGHADQDRANPPEAIAAFEAAMDEAGITYTSAIYPGAPHGFTMADTSAYDEAGTERHFAELQALLARTLGRR
ncbi:dienelactone hydrolase family protein [Aeromicrobium wangtongii]|uniref:dienelactone hydrolase family protein n=1 Tax=Aeromicrobium wangtongii TaxID=2969247 RepID=UPI0020175592|nr:dienelactone hydrolase family protein [Aeromicrobium wangtongii]MCL3817308.1 dienelactone hydrolase family protein [Aeromicrobium wangtongii]